MEPRETRAEKLATTDFIGKDDKTGFADFAEGIRTWAQALYRDAREHLDKAEDQEEDMSVYLEEKMEDEPHIKEFAERLHEKLCNHCKLGAKPYTKNLKRNGLAVWQRLNKEFDPRELINATVGYEAIARPPACKSIAEAKVRLQEWYNESKEYEVKLPGRLKDDGGI